MRYHVLATDYDGTLAQDGRVDAATVRVLEKLLATGRKLILVTGRELPELLKIFPEIHLFARVVAENGALLYRPDTREEKLLAESPPPSFAEALRQRGIERLSVGQSIVATWRPYETTVLEVIQELGLELQVIFNKDAVMVLPSGVNKATGLAAALTELGLSAHEVVGIGDAENDHAFLSLCECSAAVSNALPSLKDRVDLVTEGHHGAGVAELSFRLAENDLADMEGLLKRHRLLLGHRVQDGTEFTLPPYGLSLLVAGPSGSGKSTAATSVLERLCEHNYQYCIIDPEGDYENLEGTVTLGSSGHGPTVEEVLQVLADARTNAVVNLIGLSLNDRPPFFLKLLPLLLEMRARTGRPHWLVVDEAHHLLPASWAPGPQVLPRDLQRTLFITVHPNQVAPEIIKTVDVVLAVGGSPQTTVAEFISAFNQGPPELAPVELQPGEVLVWSQTQRRGEKVRPVPSRTERRRHTRKYTEGELPPDRSFYFRGPEGKLNLRAQNLILFLQMADGVDEDTWRHHLRQGDYSRWFRDGIKDENLAAEAAELEKQPEVAVAEGRENLRRIVEKYYTLPTGLPLPIAGTDNDPQRKKGLGQR